MTDKISFLKNVKSLVELAPMLNIAPSNLSYILYKIPKNDRYNRFEISKNSGGKRVILEPNPRLKYLQHQLKVLLYDCVDEIKGKNEHFGRSAHGFQKNKSIVTNAYCHIRNRFVFNIDISDFFDAINFGRVRGLFMSDHNFALDPKVATIIAQIACHDNRLPQGSPCSPIVSDLVAHILDRRLSAFSKEERSTYTRYADDITFSTNQQEFPSAISKISDDGTWHVGEQLEKLINKSGFEINTKKTRMSLYNARQTVTGLVVNSKPNINQEYYRLVRAMCASLYRSGSYCPPISDQKDKDDRENGKLTDTAKLEGMLSHIYFVKLQKDRRHNKRDIQAKRKHAAKHSECRQPEAVKELYRRFLFHKYFMSPKEPLIVTEGKTDIVHIKSAIHALSANFSILVDHDGNLKVRCLKRNGHILNTLQLAEGVSGQTHLVQNYRRFSAKYTYKPMGEPIIIVCDNYSGVNNLLNKASEIRGRDRKIERTSRAPFYHIVDNLYLVKLPENGDEEVAIEDLHEGKLWEPFKSNERKVEFAEHIRKSNNIDFVKFAPLLERIEKCIKYHAAKTSDTMTTTPQLKA